MDTNTQEEQTRKVSKSEHGLFCSSLRDYLSFMYDESSIHTEEVEIIQSVTKGGYQYV